MRLTDEERETALAELPGWRWDGDARAIRRTYRFADFPAAFSFMTRVAMAAEKADHHPDWSNSWNRVDIALSTHSAGGLTALDLEMARTIDGLAGSNTC